MGDPGDQDARHGPRRLLGVFDPDTPAGEVVAALLDGVAAHERATAATATRWRADMRPVAICFDLDGCLVDSTQPITTAINAGLAALDLPEQDPASLAWCIGPPLHDNYERLLADLGADPGLVPAAVAAYRDAYGPLALELTEVVAGIPDLLARLDHDLLVVTSKPTQFAGPILEQVGLLGYFQAVYGPDLDIRSESKVDTLARAVTTHGLEGQHVVMVGDRRHDVAAGLANDCTTIGVTWGAGSRDELVEAGVDHVVDAPDQLGVLLA